MTVLAHHPLCPVTACRRAPGPTGACSDHTDRVIDTGPLAGITGLTYRQLDYWVRIGLLRPDDPQPGSGQTRSWPPEEVAVAHTIARLLDAGLELRAAARAARQHATEPGPVTLRAGIRLHIDPQ